MRYEINAYSNDRQHLIFKDLLKDIHSYELPNLEAALRKEMILYLKKAEDHEYGIRSDSSLTADDNYGKVMEVYYTICYWNELKKDADYDFEITKIYTKNYESILVFEIDASRLTLNQMYYAFEMLADQAVFKVF